MSFINELIEKIVKKQKKEQFKLLEEGKTNELQNADSQEINKKDIKVDYFSRVDDGIHNHDVRVICDGEIFIVGNLSNKKGENNAENKKDTQIREIVSEIEKVFKPISEAESMYELDNLKERVKCVLQEITQNNSNFVLDEEIINFINDFKPEQVIDYKELDNLPKKIDIDKLTPSQKREISTKMRTRIKELNQISTPDDAWKDREKILSFIKSIENILSNPFEDANIENNKKGSSKEINNIPNEDGALYSVYLKIEEKRIWKNIKLTIAKYANNNEMDKEDLNKLMEAIRILNTYELHDIQRGFSSEILTYIINQMKEMDTEKYLEEIKENDLLIAKMINSKFPNMENKDKILPFFYSRIASLGQFSDKKGNLLRKFIETTDFIDEDNTETKQFLLLASQIEKIYIKSQYKDLLEISNEANKANMKSFKERVATNIIITDKNKTRNEFKPNLEKDENMTKE